MKRLVCCLAIALLPVSASAARWGPTWSEVSGERYSKATMHRYPAVIKSVDGRHYTDRVLKIEPGSRTIVVQSPMRKGFRGSDQELKLDIEPCKRYYVNAQFKSGTGPDWEPVVAKVEPIAGCKSTTAK